MKRFSNILFYVTSCLLMITSYYNYFAGEEYPWMIPLILISTLILLAAYVLNVVDRYSGMLVFLRSVKYGFDLNMVLGKGPSNWRKLSFVTSIGFALFFGFLFVYLNVGTYWAGIILLISGLEKCIYYLLSIRKKWFRLGMNEKYLVIHNGNFRIIPFAGLKAIEEKYDEILFIYNNGRVHEIYSEMVTSGDQEKFMNALKSLAQNKNAAITLLK